MDIDPDPRRVTVYTGAQYLDHVRGGLPEGGFLHDPSRYEAA